MNFFKNLFRNQSDKDMGEVSSRIVQISHGLMLSDSPDYNKAIKDLEILRVKYAADKHPEIYNGITSEIKKLENTVSAIEDEQDNKTKIVSIWKWENKIEFLTGQIEALEDELALLDDDSEEYAELDSTIDQLEEELETNKNELATARGMSKHPTVAQLDRGEDIGVQFAQALKRQLERHEKKQKQADPAAKTNLFTDLQYALTKGSGGEGIGVSFGNIKVPNRPKASPKIAEKRARRKENINKKRVAMNDSANEDIRAKIDSIDSKMKNQES